MGRICIILCVSWINDRSAALAFEAISKPYFRKIEELPQSLNDSGAIETIYVMFDFDPVTPRSASPVQFDRFRKKKREAEATVEIYVDEFNALGNQERLHLLAHRMTEALHLIGRNVPSAANEMSELIALLDRFHAVEIPGYQPRRHDENPARAGRTAEDSAIVDEGVRAAAEQAPKTYQLVVQCGEKLFAQDGLLENLEAALEKKLRAGEVLDGHDVGGGKLNFFFQCAEPEALARRITPVLKKQKLIDAAILAYSEAGEEEYTVLWPPSFDQPFEL